MIPGNLVLLLTLGLSILAVPLAAPAQEMSKAKRIGFLGLNSPAAVPHHAEAFRHGLRELGWVDGGNIAIEYRWAEGRPDRLPALARDLVQLNVDVIVTSGAPSALAAKQATRTIAIVMAQVNDPVALGLVASPSATRREHHGIRQSPLGDGDEAPGAAQGDRSQDLSRSRPRPSG